MRRATYGHSKIPPKHGTPIAPEHGHEAGQAQQSDFKHHGLSLSNGTTVLNHGSRDVFTPKWVGRHSLRVLHVVTTTTERRRYIFLRTAERANDIESISWLLARSDDINGGLFTVVFYLALERNWNEFRDVSLTISC